ncbi:MAG: hypothetical protein R3231_06185, partial [bacterium]|nr:hypothetical protein [bacterium]
MLELPFHGFLLALAAMATMNTTLMAAPPARPDTLSTRWVSVFLNWSGSIGMKALELSVAFYDDTGVIGDIANHAYNKGGILWVNAAGNYSATHYD